MGAIGSKEYNSLIEQYAAGQEWLNDVSVEIEGGENELDPLVLMRAYEAERNVDLYLSLASQFCLNKRVVFRNGGKEVHTFVYTGGDLGKKFAGKVYLMDVLFKMAFGLLLKKLTPPSADSESEERQLDEPVEVAS